MQQQHHRPLSSVSMLLLLHQVNDLLSTVVYTRSGTSSIGALVHSGEQHVLMVLDSTCMVLFQAKVGYNSSISDFSSHFDLEQYHA